ncbi:MAG: antitoxin [Coraliomargarita sp.]
MKTAKLFETGRSRAIRLPKSWVTGVSEVTLERHEDHIVIRPRNPSLKHVAEACAEIGGEFPDRLPQSETGVRVSFDD